MRLAATRPWAARGRSNPDGVPEGDSSFKSERYLYLLEWSISSDRRDPVDRCYPGRVFALWATVGWLSVISDIVVADDSSVAPPKLQVPLRHAN